jgi:hypothetical protein
MHFVVWLGITNKCIVSYQFIISPSCCYMPIWIFLLIKFCVVCGCVYIMWRPGACWSVGRYASGRLIIYTQSHTTQNIINKKSKLACNSESIGELPEDDTQLPKHVAAAKWNNKLIGIEAFVGYSWMLFPWSLYLTLPQRLTQLHSCRMWFVLLYMCLLVILFWLAFSLPPFHARCFHGYVY